MIKVIVNGALGKMGKVLTRCVKEDKDLELVCGASLPTGETTDYKLYTRMVDIEESADVIIDFSHFSALDDVLAYATKSKTALVIATTGFTKEQLEKIKEASKIFGKNVMNVVTVNPPYMNDLHGIKNPDMPKAIARHEVLCTLEDVVREASAVLKQNGRFYMVHRPHRLVEIITMMTKYKLEPKRMRLVHPYKDKEANMVLIEGLKGGKSMIKVESPIVVYESENVYTEQLLKLYNE